MEKSLVEKMYNKTSWTYAVMLNAQRRSYDTPSEENLYYYDYLKHNLDGMYIMLTLTFKSDILETPSEWDSEYKSMIETVEQKGTELYEKYVKK